MHRRARHLNARHAGAGLVLDARRISGLNDGDAVSTWNDVSGNGWNATGASTARPLHKTAIQGGQPVLRFDGVNDQLTVASGAYSLTSNVGYMHTFAVCKDSAESSGDASHAVVFISSATDSGSTRHCLWSRLSSVAGVFSAGRRLDSDGFLASPSAGSAAAFSVCRAEGKPASGTMRAAKNGISSSTQAYAVSGNTSGTNSVIISIGAVVGGSTNRINGDIGFAAIYIVNLSASLVKRLEHSAAFSFKIQCS